MLLIFIFDLIVIFKFIVVIFIVGICIEIVLNLLENFGNIFLIFLCNLVLIGMIDWLVVCVCCKLLWYVLIICWLFIEEWMVVMVLELMLNVLFNILMMGIM